MNVLCYPKSLFYYVGFFSFPGADPEVLYMEFQFTKGIRFVNFPDYFIFDFLKIHNGNEIRTFVSKVGDPF